MADKADNSSDNTGRRKSTRIHTKGRRLSFGEEENRGGDKRKRDSEDEDMASKQRKGDDGNPEPTNGEIMRAVNAIAGRLDELASKKDLDRVEKELHNKMHERSRDTNQQIKTNNRMIAEMRSEMAEQKATIGRLQDRVEKQEGRTAVAGQLAATKRMEAQQAAYMRCRRSFRIWPVDRSPGQPLEESIRLFFKEKVKVPDSLADNVNIDTIRQAVEQPARSKIKSCLLYTSPSPRDRQKSRMPSSA